MIAQIGGVIKAILILGTLIYEYFGNKLFLEEMAGQIFNIVDDKPNNDRSNIVASRNVLKTVNYAPITTGSLNNQTEM